MLVPVRQVLKDELAENGQDNAGEHVFFKHKDLQIQPDMSSKLIQLALTGLPSGLFHAC